MNDRHRTVYSHIVHSGVAAVIFLIFAETVAILVKCAAFGATDGGVTGLGHCFLYGPTVKKEINVVTQFAVESFETSAVLAPVLFFMLHAARELYDQFSRMWLRR